MKSAAVQSSCLALEVFVSVRKEIENKGREPVPLRTELLEIFAGSFWVSFTQPAQSCIRIALALRLQVRNVSHKENQWTRALWETSAVFITICFRRLALHRLKSDASFGRRFFFFFFSQTCPQSRHFLETVGEKRTEGACKAINV